MIITPAVAAKELLDRRIAHDTLLGFIQYTYKNFIAKAHHLKIIDALERVRLGTLKRLMIWLPPRHGKSLIVSRRFPAFVLGHDPMAQVMMVSYQERLATVFGRDVRNTIDGLQYKNIFPNVSIAVDQRAAGQWNTADGGGFLSVGLGGGRGTGATGFGASILLIDDPIRGVKDASSKVVLDSIQESLASDILTRLQPDAAVVYIGTRWAWNDPAGFIMENDTSNEWEIIRLPALAEVGDPLGRAPGDALWPEWYSKEYLLDLRNNPSKLGPRQFESLYQQNPTVITGSIFDVTKFHRWTPASLPKQFDMEVISVDTNVDVGDKNDLTSIQHWAKSGALFYLLDEVSGNWSMTQQLNAFRIFCESRPWVATKLVEKQGLGSALIDMLGRWVSGLIPVNPIGSKEQRALAIEPYLSAGNLFIPEDKSASWVGNYVLEFSQFPFGKHDDSVDATTQAVNWLAKTGYGQLGDYSSQLLYAFGSRG